MLDISDGQPVLQKLREWLAAVCGVSQAAGAPSARGVAGGRRPERGTSQAAGSPQATEVPQPAGDGAVVAFYSGTSGLSFVPLPHSGDAACPKFHCWASHRPSR